MSQGSSLKGVPITSVKQGQHQQPDGRSRKLFKNPWQKGTRHSVEPDDHGGPGVSDSMPPRREHEGMAKRTFRTFNPVEVGLQDCGL